ncbi:MAG: hypothetical protein V1929_05790 [bacterium]
MNGRRHLFPVLAVAAIAGLFAFHVVCFGAAISFERTFLVLNINPRLVLDWNHDRTIDAADESQSTVSNPFRFWKNDDNDVGNEAPFSTSDIPGPRLGIEPDSDNGHVDGRCDLTDFFPLWLDLKPTIDQLASSGVIQYKLRQADAAVKAVYTDLTRWQAGRYLRIDENRYGASFNQNSYEADTFAITASGVALSDAFVNKIRDDASKGVLLIEGTRATEAPLVLEIWKNGEKVCEKAMPLSIYGVEQMYRRINLRPSGGLPTSIGQPANYPDSLCNGKNFIAVHGFNVTADEARGWTAEMFKRLYWSGSRARFWGVTWEGDEGLINPALYVEDVVNAFQAAENLYAQIYGIQGAKIIMAHSLGNMVVSSAIKDYGLNVDKYFMLDAAVAVECYDPAAFDASIGNFMVHEDWVGYDSRTWCSTWFRLFETLSPPDDRAKLTWQGRFASVLPVAYNFYSSGDEAFEIFPGTPDFDTGLPDWVDNARYCWQKQEMLKGSWSSAWAGWGFAGALDAALEFLRTYTAAEANAATDEQLRENPVFLHDPPAMFSPTIPDQTVNEILAKAVPALSYGAGGNPINGARLNYNANDHKPNGWGRDSFTYGTKWLHNDAKKMAYFYTYALFDKFVEMGELR